MKVSVDTTGLDKVFERLARLPLAQRAVGEVYIAGQRNQNLAEYHASPAPREKMPLRNVFFLPPGRERDVARIMARGVKDVLQGRSSGMVQAVSDAAKLAAQTFQANIDKGQTTTGKIAPLSPAYKKRKDAEHGTGLPVLVASGSFQRSIKSRATRET